MNQRQQRSRFPASPTDTHVVNTCSASEEHVENGVTDSPRGTIGLRPTVIHVVMRRPTAGGWRLCCNTGWQSHGCECVTVEADSPTVTHTPTRRPFWTQPSLRERDGKGTSKGRVSLPLAAENPVSPAAGWHRRQQQQQQTPLSPDSDSSLWLSREATGRTWFHCSRTSPSCGGGTSPLQVPTVQTVPPAPLPSPRQAGNNSRRPTKGRWRGHTYTHTYTHILYLLLQLGRN